MGAALVALALAWGCGPSDGPRAGQPAARPAPDFELATLAGPRLRLSDLRGQFVIIDFWATWCAPCVFEPAELNRFLRSDQSAHPSIVLGVEVGGASAEEIQVWADENDAVAEYPILMGASEALAREFGVIGFPALVVVTPEGSIALVEHGVTTAEELAEHLARIRIQRPAGVEVDAPIEMPEASQRKGA